METMKTETSLVKALAICAVNRKIGSLLVSGPGGSGKSFNVRNYMREWQLPVTEVPLHVSEDMLDSRLNIEKMLHQGCNVYEAGLLERSQGRFVYVDDSNLLRPAILNTLFLMQRDPYTGLPRFTLVGTMNPAESTLRQEVLEDFALFVQLEEPDLEDRLLVLKAVRAGKTRYGEAPYERDQLMRAAAELTKVKPSETILTLAASYCRQAGAAGNYTDLLLLETACTLAALEGKDYVLPRHMEEAALYVLPHQMHKQEQAQQSDQNQENSSQQNSSQESSSQQSDQKQAEQNNSPDDGADPNRDDQKPSGASNGPEPETADSDEGETNPEEQPDEQQNSETSDGDGAEMPANNSDGGTGGMELPEQVAMINKALLGMSFSSTGKADRFARKGSGRRMLTRSDNRQGRYVRAVTPQGKVIDLALDATIRAAAPYQRFREKDGLAVAIRQPDWRSKIRERRIGRTILFAVDASGSMGAKKRMEAVKGAIYSLLQDAYEKRDRVGLIVFRRTTAELLIPFTRSIELARHNLDQLPTGGRTPLAAGLELAYDELQRLFRRDPHERPLLVLVTDGRATYGSTGQPVEEALDWGEALATLGVESIIIDTEQDFISLGIARQIAQKLDATYYSILNIDKETVIGAVRASGGKE